MFRPPLPLSPYPCVPQQKADPPQKVHGDWDTAMPARLYLGGRGRAGEMKVML